MAKSIGERVVDQSIMMIARELTRDTLKKFVPKLKNIIANVGGKTEPNKVSKYDDEAEVAE